MRTFPKDSALLGRDTVRALIFYAFKVWSDIAPLNFHEVAGSNADIQIDFTKDDHDDSYPFDGPGGAVAHAFFPGGRFTAGVTHFDDDEPWTYRSPGWWKKTKIIVIIKMMMTLLLLMIMTMRLVMIILMTIR